MSVDGTVKCYKKKMKKYFIFINGFSIHSFPCSTSTVINERNSDENQRAQQQSWRRLQRIVTVCAAIRYSTVQSLKPPLFIIIMCTCVHTRVRNVFGRSVAFCAPLVPRFGIVPIL